MMMIIVKNWKNISGKLFWKSIRFYGREISGNTGGGGGGDGGDSGDVGDGC